MFDRGFHGRSRSSSTLGALELTTSIICVSNLPFYDFQCQILETFLKIIQPYCNNFRHSLVNKIVTSKSFVLGEV